MALEVYSREAAEFYADVFETERPQFMTYGDAHQDDGDLKLPEEAKDLIMHTNLHIRGSRLMFSDNFPGTPYTVGNNITIAFIDDDIEFMKAAFERLKVGGKVEMELQETFWSKCYGVVVDKFGIQWQFSHEEK